MFESKTRQDQMDDERARGWQPETAGAMPYATAEMILLRGGSDISDIFDAELVFARRDPYKGIPDCRGRWECKQGGYVLAKHDTSRDAMMAVLQNNFGLNREQVRCDFVGLVGPELYRSTLALVGDRLTLNISQDQGETTPFLANMFLVAAPDDFDLSGSAYAARTEQASWIKIRDLIDQRGDDPDVLYWTMLFKAIRWWYTGRIDEGQLFGFHEPGEHVLTLR